MTSRGWAVPSSDQLELKGGAKKNSLNSHHRFCLISLTKNMLEGWFIGKVGSIVLSGVQKLLCTIFGSRDISKLKWGIRFQNVWILGNLVSWNLVSHIVLLLFWLPHIYKNGFELSACFIWMSSLKLDMSKPSKMIITWKTMHKSWQYQISRH